MHAGLTMPHVAKKALLFALVIETAFYYVGLYDLAATRHAEKLIRQKRSKGYEEVVTA